MCGILGYFDFNKELPFKKKFKKSLDLMAHRGPDSFGVSSFEFGFLGHRRLSIIDLSKNGNQPMSNLTKTIYITFNGEIFNYKNIRKDLSKKYVFKSNSDTEVLIYGYEEWGIDGLLEKINGQFAFGIYDLKENKIILARDRVGINPIYYHYGKNKIIFSSEIKSIKYFLNETKLNKNSIDFYFKTGYIPAPSTIYENIFKIKPAHYIVICKDKIFEKKYWDVNFKKKHFSEKNIVHKIRSQLDESVKERMMSDVPIGAFLSGGVDSSAIVSTMAKYKPKLHTFSIGFENSKYDETKFAENIAKEFNTNHHVKILTDKDFYKYLDKIPYHYDEPFADSSQIPTMFVSEFAKKYVTVSLSGDGGDELFGGYERYFILKRNKMLFDFARLTKNLWFSLSKSNFIDKFPFKIRNYLDFLHYYNFSNIRYDGDILNFAQKVDFNYYLPDDILTKVDRASLAFSLESRPPLLDHKFVELAFSIPSNIRYKNNVPKYIFKKALEDRVPKYKILINSKGATYWYAVIFDKWCLNWKNL